MGARFAGAVTALMLTLAGCDLARVVDCESNGRYVRTESDAWCVYESRTAVCPPLLPVEHRLSWGGLGCASTEHDPVPSHPCLDTGECEPTEDGG